MVFTVRIEGRKKEGSAKVAFISIFVDRIRFGRIGRLCRRPLPPTCRRLGADPRALPYIGL